MQTQSSTNTQPIYLGGIGIGASVNLQLVQIGESVHQALHDYNKVANTWLHRLAGACAVGAYFMTLEANRRGIPCEMYHRPSHAFCVSQGIIYDPTCMQFTGCKDFDGYMVPRVGVFTQKDLKALDLHYWYQDEYPYSNTTQESITYINSNWLLYQRPECYQMIWIGDRATLSKAPLTTTALV
jgi:hypothetical protein